MIRVSLPNCMTGRICYYRHWGLLQESCIEHIWIIPHLKGTWEEHQKKITESEHSRAQRFNPAQQCQVPALHGNSTSDVREKQANPGKIPHAKKYQSFSSSVEKKKPARFTSKPCTEKWAERKKRSNIRLGRMAQVWAAKQTQTQSQVAALTERCLSRGQDNPNSYSGIQNHFSHNLSLEKSFIINN